MISSKSSFPKSVPAEGVGDLLEVEVELADSVNANHRRELATVTFSLSRITSATT